MGNGANDQRQPSVYAKDGFLIRGGKSTADRASYADDCTEGFYFLGLHKLPMTLAPRLSC